MLGKATQWRAARLPQSGSDAAHCAYKPHTKYTGSPLVAGDCGSIPQDLLIESLRGRARVDSAENAKGYGVDMLAISARQKCRYAAINAAHPPASSRLSFARNTLLASRRPGNFIYPQPKFAAHAPTRLAVSPPHCPAHARTHTQYAHIPTINSPHAHMPSYENASLPLKRVLRTKGIHLTSTSLKYVIKLNGQTAKCSKSNIQKNQSDP